MMMLRRSRLTSRNAAKANHAIAEAHEILRDAELARNLENASEGMIRDMICPCLLLLPHTDIANELTVSDRYVGNHVRFAKRRAPVRSISTTSGH
jgi:hypothetical protein